MHRESVRKFGAFSLAAMVWFSAISFAPVTARAQASEDAKDNKKAKAVKKDEKAKPQAPATTGPKALSVNEDPAQIGKRKINSGSDKLFGWLGGSQEKEVSVGRQLALEVEQQSKLIEDPIITEYINRVGQNVVLHSDAKIPF